MQLVPITIILSAITGCKTDSTTANTVYNNDTLVLIKKESVFEISGHTSSQVLLQLSELKNLPVDSTSKILLVLNQPVIKASPDGVYEIYLTNTLQDIDKLSPAHTNFTSLLDLYSFTAPGSKQQIEIDITRQINNLYNQKQYPVYLIFRFAPVQLADGTLSTITGNIRLSGLSVIRVDE